MKRNVLIVILTVIMSALVLATVSQVGYIGNFVQDKWISGNTTEVIGASDWLTTGDVMEVPDIWEGGSVLDNEVDTTKFAKSSDAQSGDFAVEWETYEFEEGFNWLSIYVDQFYDTIPEGATLQAKAYTKAVSGTSNTMMIVRCENSTSHYDYVFTGENAGTWQDDTTLDSMVLMDNNVGYTQYDTGEITAMTGATSCGVQFLLNSETAGAKALLDNVEFLVNAVDVLDNGDFESWSIEADYYYNLTVQLPKFINVTDSQLNFSTPDTFTDLSISLGDETAFLGSPDSQLTNGIVSYWKFDETDGVNFSDSLGINNGTGNNAGISGAIGKINASANFTGGAYYVEYPNHASLNPAQISLSFWYKPKTLTNNQVLLHKGDASVTKGYYVDSRADGTVRFAVGNSDFSVVSTSTGVVTTDNWYFLVFTYNGSEKRIYVDGVLNGSVSGGNSVGTHTDTGVMRIGSRTDETTQSVNALIDEVAILSRAITSTEIEELYNNATGKQYPFGTGSFSNNSVVIEVNLNNHLSTCEHTSGMCNVTFQLNTTSNGRLNVTMNNFNYSVLANFTYKNETVEKSLNTYTLLVYHPNVLASFYYNNTGYSTTPTNYSYYNRFITTLRPDWITGNDFNVTYPMYWNITLAGEQGTTDEVNQTVHRIFIGNCTTATEETIKFQIYNETNSELINADLDIHFRVWYDDPLYYRNYSFALTGNNIYTFCKYPAEINFTTNSQMEYEATGFAKKVYYLVTTPLTSILKTVKLFLTEGTTQVRFQVIDQADDPVEDVLIKILSYDLGTDTSELTETLLTDNEGYGYAQVVLNTQRYVFILEYQGIVLLETSPTIITGTTKRFRVTLTDDYFQNYQTFQGITHSPITFSNATKTFSITYSDPTNTVVQGCLQVSRSGFSSERVISKVCMDSAASTINYVITGDVLDYTYTAVAYVVIGEEQFILDTLSVSFDETYKIFGGEAILMTFLLVVTLVMATLFSPMIGVISIILGLFFAIIMGIFSLSTPVFIGYVIIAVVVLYKVGGRN